MLTKIFDNSMATGQAAAFEAAAVLRETIQSEGRARIIAATGASQFHFLQALTTMAGIDWQSVEMFHLDEYVGLPATHSASFRNYLLTRIIRPTGMRHYHLLDGQGDLAAVCRQAGTALNAGPIDAAFVGIGENGHLAFNDPPADFTTEEPYLIVRLDEVCRRQQVGEGWFPSLSEVPERAISMSIRQILKARRIFCVVPDQRKAAAVKACVEGRISPSMPASILKSHLNVTLYLDRESAFLLEPQEISRR